MVKNKNTTSTVAGDVTRTNLVDNYPPVLCVKQVAQILVVSLNTAYELVRLGQIR